MENVVNKKRVENLVLIPGLNNTKEIWDGVTSHLDEQIHCYAVTCPATDDVNAIAVELLEKLPERFYVCGFSFGGYVALAMLAIAPERIQGIALMATSADDDNDARKLVREKAIARAENGEYEEMIGSQVGKIFYSENAGREDLLNLRVRMMNDYGAERFIAHQRASIKRPNREKELLDFKGSTLIMVGSDDQVFSVASMRKLSEQINASFFFEVSKSGHMLPMEQPKEVASLLEFWLKKNK